MNYWPERYQDPPSSPFLSLSFALCRQRKMEKDDNLMEAFLSSTEELDPTTQKALMDYLGVGSRASSLVSFSSAAVDITPISSVGDFVREFRIESKKLWKLAGPAIFTSMAQFSLGAVTQVFAGHMSTIALAAVSIENSVIAGFSFGIMVRFTLIYRPSSHFPLFL